MNYTRLPRSYFSPISQDVVNEVTNDIDEGYHNSKRTC